MSGQVFRASVIGTLVIAASLGPLAGADVEKGGLPRFSEINEHLYRGAQPKPSGLQSLSRLGIRAVIDLRGGGQRSAMEEKKVVALGMKYYSVPLRAVGAPTETQISTILSLIEDGENWPVFVHCERGCDRTGTVIACYRIRHDHWPNTRALVEARDHGMGRVERGMRDFILHYSSPTENSILLRPQP